MQHAIHGDSYTHMLMNMVSTAVGSYDLLILAAPSTLPLDEAACSITAEGLL